MSGLRDQLIAEAESIFQLQGDHYDAEEVARKSALLRSVVSKLDELFEELAAHTSTTTYRHYMKEWSRLSKQHIRTIQNELRLQQQSNARQPVVSTPFEDFPIKCAECDLKQQELDTLSSENDALHIELEQYKLVEAEKFFAEGKCRDAAAIYSRLLHFRAAEVHRKLEVDPEGAFAAEGKALTIKAALAMTFMDLNNMSTAEEMIREVWHRRKTRREIDATHSVQRQLCILLRRQGSAAHLEEATDLHREIWHRRPRRKLNANDTWYLENGHNLALVLAQRTRLEDAIEKLELVLAESESQEHTILAAQQLAVWLLEKGKPKKAATVLELHLLQDTYILSTEISRCANLVAYALAEQGHHVRAEPLWRRIYNESIQDGPTVALSAGWELSLCLSHLSKHEEAKVLLNKLMTTQPQANEVDDNKATLKLHALLAYTCRQLNDIPISSAHALLVWQSNSDGENVKDRDILGLGPEYRTGYSLVWASFVKGKTDQDRKVAQIYWREMRTAVADGKMREDRQVIAECWRKLATHVDADARRRGVRSATAKEIRKTCDELELTFEPQAGNLQEVEPSARDSIGSSSIRTPSSWSTVSRSPTLSASTSSRRSR